MLLFYVDMLVKVEDVSSPFVYEMGYARNKSDAVMAGEQKDGNGAGPGGSR
jgi:hypothetical protein